jgi:hypothetical protein
MRDFFATAFFMGMVGVFFGCGGYTWVNPQIVDQETVPTTAYVCLSLPDDEIEEAIEAVEMWDQSLRQWRRFVPIVDDTTVGCSYWVKETARHKLNDPDAIGWVSIVGGRTIFMLKGSYESATKQILLHEFGHALGAQHINGTLMHPTLGKEMTPCPDVVTVAQIAAWNNVDLKKLGWCRKDN